MTDETPKTSLVEQKFYLTDEDLVVKPRAVRCETYGFTFSAPADMFVSAELERAQKDAIDAYTDLMLRDVFSPREPVRVAPPTRRDRIRRWLGRKLYDAATRLDPDLCDY